MDNLNFDIRHAQNGSLVWAVLQNAEKQNCQIKIRDSEGQTYEGQNASDALLAIGDLEEAFVRIYKSERLVCAALASVYGLEPNENLIDWVDSNWLDDILIDAGFYQPPEND
jgi:hypothetical protein